MIINLINKSNNPNPEYAKEGDSGFDFRANLTERIVLNSFDRCLVPTGLYFQIPIDYELQVRSRSGLALKNGIMVLNSPGTVDSGYINEIGVILFNSSKVDFIINHGDRIAQGVICSVQQKHNISFNNVDRLEASERNMDGFGSTGV